MSETREKSSFATFICTIAGTFQVMIGWFAF
jgi:hypothetical protein